MDQNKKNQHCETTTKKAVLEVLLFIRKSIKYYKTKCMLDQKRLVDVIDIFKLMGKANLSLEAIVNRTE